jgi:hypothetical protein
MPSTRFVAAVSYGQQPHPIRLPPYDWCAGDPNCSGIRPLHQFDLMPLLVSGRSH